MSKRIPTAYSRRTTSHFSVRRFRCLCVCCYSACLVSQAFVIIRSICGIRLQLFHFAFVVFHSCCVCLCSTYSSSLPAMVDAYPPRNANIVEMINRTCFEHEASAPNEAARHVVHLCGRVLRTQAKPFVCVVAWRTLWTPTRQVQFRISHSKAERCGRCSVWLSPLTNHHYINTIICP